MLAINNLSFTYRRSKSMLFKDFSMDIEKGKVYGLLGKNGVGKSTLLNLMGGLLKPSKGEIRFEGINVFRRLPSTLQEMFLVSEEFELPRVSLKRFIELNSDFYPRFDREKLFAYLDDFDMKSELRLDELSMGQKKKVFISFALAANTSLLIMDEPTNGLDIPGKSQFRKIIASGMTDDKTIIISTHQVRDIDKLLDHVVVMDKNKVLLNRPVSDICRALSFRELSGSQSAESALFVQPSVQGSSAIFRNQEKEDSELNLELLFNAILAGPDKITDCLTD